VYVPFGTAPAEFVSVAVIFAASPGAYVALSNAYVRVEGVLLLTRTALAADVIVAAATVAALISVMFAVPAATPVKSHETAPVADEAPQSTGVAAIVAAVSETE
jgi:hypothetical protein